MTWRERVGALRVDTTPLRESRDFRLLFWAGTVFCLGGMITYVALPFQLHQLTGSNFVVGALLAAAQSLQRPSKEALEPRTVRHDQIVAASALSSLGTQVGFLAGPVRGSIASGGVLCVVGVVGTGAVAA